MIGRSIGSRLEKCNHWTLGNQEEFIGFSVRRCLFSTSGLEEGFPSNSRGASRRDGGLTSRRVENLGFAASAFLWMYLPRRVLLNLEPNV